MTATATIPHGIWQVAEHDVLEQLGKPPRLVRLTPGALYILCPMESRAAISMPHNVEMTSPLPRKRRPGRAARRHSPLRLIPKHPADIPAAYPDANPAAIRLPY
jgi:hypothetical protein